ncbi:UDP-glycosyltransferase UGT5-like, partial [Chrysoperla carnea]|uniref:UDP-glycosyltransferase UGT5-like n=1 Tax=Chrysoperla carnea TaxID=189513 RepID=UPI001D080611
ILNNSECARILFFLPIPSLSHHIFYRPIIKELSLRGHQVTCITTDPINNKTLTNLTEINIHDVAYQSVNIPKQFLQQQTDRIIIDLHNFGLMIYKLMDAVLNDTKIQQLIHNETEHYDLLIVEMLRNVAGYAFKERFNCPMIGLASLKMGVNGMDCVGNPPDPNIYLDFNHKAGPNLTFFQRLYNFWKLWVLRYIHSYEILTMQNQLVKKYFGQNYSDLSDLEKSMDLLLTNSNPIFHMAQPHVPNFIEIGGLHQRVRHSLPQDLKEFLDNSKQGVIYFSLGSNVKSESLPKSKRDEILKAFEKLPYNILWKWENSTLIDKPKNVYIKQWLPQQDVLDHPNVKVFVTQGGIQSVEEAISSKVPMICIPFAVDQIFNADRIAELGIGRKMLFDDITTDFMIEIIVDVAQNISYKNNIIKVASQIWDQVTKPLDRAVWWIEYVIRHGGAKHLRCPATDLSWFQYYLFDVVGFILLIIILLINKASVRRLVLEKSVKTYLASTVFP